MPTRKIIFAPDYATKLHFDYVLDPKAAREPFLVTAIYHDDSFTYIKCAAREKPALYEMKDGKPNLITFQVENGVYIAPKIIDSGYLAIGKKKLPFVRKTGRELRRRRWTSPPRFRKKHQSPKVFCPKNVQSWLLVGLAFLMVAIMWLTGGKKPSAPAKTATLAPPTQVPLEVNETKINELQSRIEELQREQLVAQSALAQQTRLISEFARGPSHHNRAPPPVHRRPKAGRSGTGGTKTASLHVAVCLQCRADLSKDAADRDAAGTRIHSRDTRTLFPSDRNLPRSRNS